MWTNCTVDTIDVTGGQLSTCCTLSVATCPVATCLVATYCDLSGGHRWTLVCCPPFWSPTDPVSLLAVGDIFLVCIASNFLDEKTGVVYSRYSACFVGLNLKIKSNQRVTKVCRMLDASRETKEMKKQIYGLPFRPVWTTLFRWGPIRWCPFRQQSKKTVFLL